MTGRSPSAGERTVAVVFHEPVVGGASSGFLRIVPLLEDRGWRFVFWVPRPGPLERELENRGFEVAGEPRLLRYSRAALSMPPGVVARLASVPGYLWRFRRWVRRQRPAIVHANSVITIPEAVTARTTGAPVLLYVHEIVSGGTRGAAAARLIRTSTKTVVTNSGASVAALRARGVNARMAYYGLELPSVRDRQRNVDDPVIVGTLGTVSHRKGSDTFLKIAEHLRERMPNAEFRMVGPRPEGSERAWADRVIEEAQGGGVRWGATTDAFQELREWDMLVLPTRSDAFGLVIIEAMAVGLPVVASRVEGPAELVTRETGLLADAEDVAGFAAAIQELAGDPERSRRMGLAGRARVEREFSLDAQADAVHAAYMEAADLTGR